MARRLKLRTGQSAGYLRESLKQVKSAYKELRKPRKI